MTAASRATADLDRAVRPWSLSTFAADVTIPLGHPCMGGGIAPAREIVDPLEAIGFVLDGGTLDQPVVMVSVDWCEIRNEAYDLWRDALAEAAGTDRRHVLVTAIHQHDAPVVDPAAQRLLDAAGAAGAICDIEFDAQAVAGCRPGGPRLPRPPADARHPYRDRPGQGRAGGLQPPVTSGPTAACPTTGPAPRRTRTRTRPPKARSIRGSRPSASGTATRPSSP